MKITDNRAFHLRRSVGLGKNHPETGPATLEHLKETVRQIYKALKKTEKYMAIQYDYIEEILPKDIFFITTQELSGPVSGLHPEGAGGCGSPKKRALSS